MTRYRLHLLCSLACLALAAFLVGVMATGAVLAFTCPAPGDPAAHCTPGCTLIGSIRDHITR